MSSRDHTDAEWADGPKLLAWMRSEHIPIIAPTDSWKRKVRRWNRGAQARIWDVDALLTRAGVPITLMPDEIWREYDNGRRRRPTAAEPDLAVAA
jgi:hypothetical protein